jgi:hypothetical protein
MPQVRVTLSKPAHDQLKIIAIGLDTTLAGVVIQACQRYIELVGILEPKAKKRTTLIPMGDSRAPKKRA